jgi:FixJ family two-component response regulator
MLLPYRSQSNGADKRDVRGFMVSLQKVIAVVDDDPDMLKAIGRLLAAHGFRPEAFASAEAFLNRSWAREPACLVLDIQLGGMSGIDLQRRLKASGSRVPIIFITAIEDEAARGEAINAGCVAYLRKPFMARLLIGAIDEATGR